MAKFYDENGVEVTGVLTQAEADAAAQAKSDEALATYKKDHPEPTEDPRIGELSKSVTDLTASLTKKEQDAAIARFTGGDAEKETKLRAEFDNMSGYTDVNERASKAALAAFGEAKVVNVGDYSGTGGGRSVDGAPGGVPLSRPGDLAVQRALGISAEDVTKFGPQIEAAENKNK